MLHITRAAFLTFSRSTIACTFTVVAGLQTLVAPVVYALLLIFLVDGDGTNV